MFSPHMFFQSLDAPVSVINNNLEEAIKNDQNQKTYSSYMFIQLWQYM